MVYETEIITNNNGSASYFATGFGVSIVCCHLHFVGTCFIEKREAP